MRTIAALLLFVGAGHATGADTVDDLLKEAREALKQGKVDDAIALCGKAAKADAKDSRPLLLRGSIYEATGKHDEAVADFSAVIQLDPKGSEAYNRRGSEQFKRGKIAESLADFDKFLELRPAEFPGHWKRGISCYYAGKFAEGKKQFDAYEKVDTNDVENAVWHFLCNARLAGIDMARKELLKIGKDKRVPMMQVYELFAGKIKPDDVMKAVKEGDPAEKELNYRSFYAHLYLGLYAEAAGDKKLALEHLTQAAQKHKIGHYMWDVARVHMEILKKEAKEK